MATATEPSRIAIHLNEKPTANPTLSGGIGGELLPFNGVSRVDPVIKGHFVWGWLAHIIMR